MLDVLKSFLNEVKPKEDTYLVSCFYQDGEWKVDFYDEKEHKIYTYTKKDGKIIEQEDQIFQKEKKKLEKLDIDNVKVGRTEALEKLNEQGDKVISILQVIDGKTIWNITLITSEFNIYNLWLNATTGDVVKETKESLFNFKQK